MKVPLFIQGGIHGNEYEGVDAAMQVIERLALTPYGTDPEVDRILDQAIVVFNPIQNPDGRVLGAACERQRVRPQPRLPHAVAAGDHSTVAIMQRWLPPETARPPRLRDADTDRGDDEAAQPGHRVRPVAEVEPGPDRLQRSGHERGGLEVTRPINDWCCGRRRSEGILTGLCADGTTTGAAVGRELGRLGPVLHPDVLPARRA